MKICILTSSRADFGIYYPLIKKMLDDTFFTIEIVAFGTHLDKRYGYTIDEITDLGIEVKYKIQTITQNETPLDISNSISDTISKFAKFWKNNTFDLIFVFGDRYEMFAAVSAGSPFNIDFAHLHAGETTLGAIDNMYRHSISLMSKYLFVSTDVYKNRAIEVKSSSENIYNVGALSIDNLTQQKLYNKSEFLKVFNIDLTKPTILTTFHPETMSIHKNEYYINELLESLNILSKKYQIVITLPNTDTTGTMIRKRILKFTKDLDKIFAVESFGMKGYLSCMKHCSFLLGNTSSGFVEASFFPKWVINIGDRQKGRIITENILSVPVEKQKILEAVEIVQNKSLLNYNNIYGTGNSANEIVEILKTLKNILK